MCQRLKLREHLSQSSKRLVCQVVSPLKNSCTPIDPQDTDNPRCCVSAPSSSLNTNTRWAGSFLSLGPRVLLVKQEAELVFQHLHPANSYISFKALLTCPSPRVEMVCCPLGLGCAPNIESAMCHISLCLSLHMDMHVDRLPTP